jgi:galactokinase
LVEEQNLARNIKVQLTRDDKAAVDKILQLAQKSGVNIKGARIRRTSSRFCLGVEHGDYNGTELLGVGTNRFIWMAYKANEIGRFRLFSGNFPSDGVVEFTTGNIPAPKTIVDSWARFPYGAEYILRREGLNPKKGIDAVVYGNIPGGGMSRSASLSLNLILSILDVNSIEIKEQFKIVELAQTVENDYIGSPCGKLDQIMILFAREGMGTHYNPKNRSIKYVPLGKGAADFRLVSLDTGTVRPGLEKSTYKIRRAECEELVEILKKAGYEISCLADIRNEGIYKSIITEFADRYSNLCDRLKYIYHTQKRFYKMLKAWKAGDIKTVGSLFRQDGIALRDEYKISGPELETMCDIVRTVPGVFGERMLGGGDKGASGALVAAGSINAVKKAVDIGYPHSRPEYAEKYAVHICKMVDGVRIYDGLFD